MAHVYSGVISKKEEHLYQLIEREQIAGYHVKRKRTYMLCFFTERKIWKQRYNCLSL